MEYFDLEFAPIRSTQDSRLIHLDVHLAIRKIFFQADDQVASDFCLLDACREISFNLVVFISRELVYEDGTSLLEVLNQQITFFDPSLKMIE